MRNISFDRSPSFSIACVGASAGGLEALIAFFKSLPKTINMAFVLIQHLEPQHKSALSEILSRETSLNVREAKNNTQVEPAHVYVIPPNTHMTISRRRLRLTSRIKRTDGRYLPVDFFMASLAKTEREKAIGVILSGTGSDGTQGAKSIKANGGIVFVQDAKTAHYFGMPESVIKSGSADFVLAPGEIAQKLVRMSTHEYLHPLKQATKSRGAQNDLKRILALLRDLTGMDFSHYKEATIVRRIARQMSFHNIKNHAAYYNYLKINPAEVEILRNDILISVTSFFRDPQLFAALRKKVILPLVNKRSSQNPIRLWVPACSSGEEVYSLAIFLYEFLESRNMRPYIQIFGTDLSETLIEKARAGVYAQDISAQMSSERLRRFFVKTEAGYKISKHIRNLCIFARHDVTVDPPLSNMDIVSCRNLLIYLDTFLQNKALSMLHYALKPQGFLVLGTAESVTSVPGFFTAVDKKQKIYSKNIVSRKTMLNVEAPVTVLTTTKGNPRKMKKRSALKKELDKPQIIVRPKKTGRLKAAEPEKTIDRNAEKDIAKLKKEFTRAVKRLNVISEEKDAFNEELKAANEEIQSSNEELQSMNEELETSKEELQSTNEELLTLNEELQNKNAELTRLNSDLSNVFSSTNIPIIIVGNDLRIKRFTPTARKVMNLIPTDVDRPIGDIKLNIDIANLEEIISGVIEDMIPKEYEVMDKEGRWYSVRIRPYRTVDSKIDGAIITMIDIDAIKRSREEVQGALDYTKAIIETMRGPLVVLDKDVRIVSANKSFCDAFGVQISDVKKMRLYDLCNRQWNNPELRKLLGEVLSKRNHFNDFEMSFVLPMIGQKTMILNGRQIRLYGKDSPLILLVIEDITKRKKAEDILKRDKISLDKMVAKKSRESNGLQAKLVRARHLSVIGTLAATVAHELRNPLTDIAVSIHRIKKITQDPQVIRILNGINIRVFESDQIVTNILSYSKIGITHFEPVEINNLLRDVIQDEARNLPVGKIDIYRKTDRTKGVVIDADPVRLQEVFRNVLHNAIDAVHAGTGIIEITTDVRKDMVYITIKDNGEGIDRKDLKNVFKPFFTTKSKGMGLGLAVSKQVVVLHGGSIILKSVKGKGTTVEIALPAQKHKNA